MKLSKASLCKIACAGAIIFTGLHAVSMREAAPDRGETVRQAPMAVHVVSRDKASHAAAPSPGKSEESHAGTRRIVMRRMYY